MKKVAIIVLLELAFNMPAVLATTGIIYLGFHARMLENALIASMM